MNNQTQLIVVAGAFLALWLYEQNQMYQDKLSLLASASVPVGRLAGTVDKYVPVVANALDYWAHN